MGDFSFDLKEESEDKERKGEFRNTGPMYWKNLSPRVFLPIPGTWKMRASAEDEDREKEGRDGADD